MTGALILITADVGKMKEVEQKISSKKEIEQVEMLTGPYDLMALAKTDEMTDITQALIDKIREIDGVQNTTTNIFIE